MSAAQETLDIDYTVLALRQLAAELPMNDFGLPTGIYRTDLLPFHEYVPPGAPTKIDDPEITTGVPGDPGIPDTPAQESEELDALAPSDVSADPFSSSVDAFSLLAGQGDGAPDYMPARTSTREAPTLDLEVAEYRIAGFPAKSLHNAFVPLQYDEGFPAFEDGRPFWGRLEFESSDAYLIFQRYLQMSFGRASDPEDEDDFGIAAQGTRSINSLVLQLTPGINDAKLLELTERFKQYYHLYYWGLRAKSYDLFRVTEYRQKQELRAIETQDDHYIQTRKLRKRLEQYMESDEEFWDMMTPKTGIDMFKTITQLERVSAGIPAGGPMTKEVEGGGRSFEVAFRTMAQDQHGESVVGDTISEDGHILDKALEDPAATKILQEIIIKSGN